MFLDQLVFSIVRTVCFRMCRIRVFMVRVIFFVLLSFIILKTYATDINSNDFLINQVLWGETYYRDDFVSHSLERLQLTNPDDPLVLAAEIRLALRQKNQVLAEELLAELKKKAPNSVEYRQAKMSLYLMQSSAQQKLQQARVMSMSGRYDLAKAEYDALFQGDFPTIELSVEYWLIVAKLPKERQNAFHHLQLIYDYLNEHQIYSGTTKLDNWPYKLKQTLSSLWDDQGALALKKADLDLAENSFQKALLLNSKNDFAWVGLGDVAYERKNFVEAENAYKQALVIMPEKTSALYGLLGIYKKQSLKKAMDFLNNLPEAQKAKLKNAQEHLQSTVFEEQGQRLEKEKLWKQAVEKYQKALQLNPEDIWINYRLAQALDQAGRSKEATSLFQKLIVKYKDNPTQAYMYALYLSNKDQFQEAIHHLKTIPAAHWTKDMHALAERIAKEQKRITYERILKYARLLREQGNNQAAYAYLMRQTPTTEIKLTLAEWFFLDGAFAKALDYYKEVKNTEPLNSDARIGIIESLIALGDKKQAYYLLEQQEKTHVRLNINAKRKIANAWIAVGNPQKALTIFNQIKQEIAFTKKYKALPSEDDALIFRDAALLETQLGKPKLAQEDYKKAMLESKITSVWPSSNDDYTWLTRTHTEDDWLKRSIRANAAALYKQQETRFILHEDYWRLIGEAGTSDLRAADTIAQADWGYSDGRAFFRADKVNLGAGQFVTVNGVYYDDFGTCNLNGCTTGILQQTKGMGWDGGWQNRTWGWDIGETPVGFPVGNWIGGINYSSEIQHIGWTITASQRPMTNSLLSFSGTRDPNTGIVWGGVVATGLTLSLSYDRGEANGLWANIIASRLTGKNVETNQRILLLDGYYYKLINEDHTRCTLGLTNMVWHYDKNSLGYNLGQGGYFSPNFYVSLTVPINYRHRTDNWSYELGGSVTWSHSNTKDLLNYPLAQIIPNFNAYQNSTEIGSGGTAYGYSLLALVERRLGSHFIIGGQVDMQQSTDYTPSHVSLFLRYSLEGWEGDMSIPIVPIIPYSTFR